MQEVARTTTLYMATSLSLSLSLSLSAFGLLAGLYRGQSRTCSFLACLSQVCCGLNESILLTFVLLAMNSF